MKPIEQFAGANFIVTPEGFVISSDGISSQSGNGNVQFQQEKQDHLTVHVWFCGFDFQKPHLF